jgi:hypothetical protein
MKKSAKRKSYFKDTDEFGPGGFFGLTSFVGKVRLFVFWLLPIYMGRYIDLWGQFLWALSGDELNITRGSMQFHARVGFVMGMFGLVVLFVSSFLQHRNSWHEHESDDFKTNGKSASLTGERPDQNLSLATKSYFSPAEQRLHETIRRWPFLHDFIWGWPSLLALSLLFFGHTFDGSVAPSLVDLFRLPALDFFTAGRTPVAAINGIFLGALAYGANHALSKTARIPFSFKLVMNAGIGVLAVMAWYTLTSAMGAPTWGAEKLMTNAEAQFWRRIWGEIWTVMLKGVTFAVVIGWCWVLAKTFRIRIPTRKIKFEGADKAPKNEK